MEKMSVRSGITAQEFMERPELIVAVAGVLMIIGAFGQWGSTGGGWGIPGQSWNGFDANTGEATLIMGLIMLYSAAIVLGYVEFMREVFPVLTVSSICGVVALILALATLASPGGGGWGVYLTVIASLISLFAAFKAYTRGLGIVRRGL